MSARQVFTVIAIGALAACRTPHHAPSADTGLDAETFFGTSSGADVVIARLRAGTLHCASIGSPREALVCAEAAGLEGRVLEEREGWLAVLEGMLATGRAADTRLAWLAAHRIGESTIVGGPLSLEHRTRLDRLAFAPRGLGWRAALELRILVRDAHNWKGDRGRAAVGCVADVETLGPLERDAWPSLDGFAAGPIPRVLVRGKVRTVARTAKAEDCALGVGDASDGAPSILSTGFRLASERVVIVAVSRATRVFVDGTLVLERSPRAWGSWNRFGARLRLVGGAHRVTAEVIGSPSALFLLDEDGQPTPTVGAGPDEAPVPVRPELLDDPNPLDGLVGAGARVETAATERFVAAELARTDGLEDVASYWLETRPSGGASPSWLRAQARAAADDAIYGDDERTRRVADFFQALAKVCAGCVEPRLARARTLRDGGQVVLAWKLLEALVADAPERADVALELADLAERLAWDGERVRLAKLLAERFPTTPAALRVRLATADAFGSVQSAKAIEAALVALERGGDIVDERRSRTRDWQAVVPRAPAKSVSELEALRMAGLVPRYRAEADAVLAGAPNTGIRLTLAEEALAQGDEQALSTALAAAAGAGDGRGRLEQAATTVEGMGALSAYRLDARAVLAAFEAADKTGFDTTGPASRILDYAVISVDELGRATMLEHELIRVQSREAIQQEAEQRFPGGRILRVAVRKPDGTVLEPDVVQGKTTLTMPELAIGDVIELEHVQELGSSKPDGSAFQSPRWFFREPDKSYWRSEFVVVTERGRALELDERGRVPPRHQRTLRDGRIETRWRVDGAPAVRTEPASPPHADWLPSVRVSYGVREAEELRLSARRLETAEPIDPRLRRLAEGLVAGVPRGRTSERVRRLHAYCLEHLEEGDESYGPRVLTGHSGQRTAGFLHLARILDIPVETVLTRTKTGSTWAGEAGRLESWGGAVLRAETEDGPRWLTLSERHAPFEWLPEVLRGQEAVRLVPGLPSDRVPELAERAAFLVSGNIDLDDDGTARAALELRFRDRPAMAFRGVRARMDDAEWRRFVEQGLIATSFPSWHTEVLDTDGAAAREEDLVVRVRGSAPFWLDARGSHRAPFTVNLRGYSAAESRETPLVIETPTGVHAILRVRGANGARPRAPGPARAVESSGGRFRVSDRLEGDTLILERASYFPAQRVPPEQYPAWAATLREGVSLVERELTFTLPGRP